MQVLYSLLYAIRIRLLKMRRAFFSAKAADVLFLDIDGVLCLTDSKDMNDYSEEAIKCINQMVKDHSLKVILISGRREYDSLLVKTVDSLKKADFEADLSYSDTLLESRYEGFGKSLHDYETARSEDVFCYLNRHPEIYRFLIVDDSEYLYRNLLNLDLFLISPNGRKGFKKNNLNEAEQILKTFNERYSKWK